MFIADGSKLIEENSWPAANNEATQLLPQIQKSLSNNGIKPTDLDQVIVVTGPGSFTGVRVGVTIANVLTAFTKAKLFTINLFQLIEAKIPETHSEQNGAILIKAGRNQIYQKPIGQGIEAVEILDLAIASQDQLLDTDFFTGELPPEQLEKIPNWLPNLELISTFSAIQSISPGVIQEAKLAEPNYIKSPNITKSKK